VSQSLLPAVELPPVPCWPCKATGKCVTCGGTGKTSTSPRCGTCGGNGKCITCGGTTTVPRVRRAIAPRLTTPSAGLEICWSCRGARFCGTCSGSGFEDDGKPCETCYMRDGICAECGGSGQLKPDD
jgi:hypothetical protein